MHFTSLILEQSFMVSPKVKHFVFKIKIESSHSNSTSFNYIPGQFITIHFEHGGVSLKRSYSIANPPAADKLELAAGYFAGGPGTEFLFNLKSGDEIQASGPYGRLTLKEPDPVRYILVATSTGVTPYRAMLQELAIRMAQNPVLEVVILQGVQYREDILYRDDFRAFAARFPKARFIACLSREQEINLGEECKGYVQHNLADLGLDAAKDLVYLCGNPSMIDDAFAYLKEQGFAMQQIIREKYLSR